MMKRMIAALAAAIPAVTLAGDALPGSLSNIHYLASGVVVLHTDGVRSGIPSCAAGQPARFAINATTPGGKVQLAGLLAAYAAGKPVRIIGSGDCSAYQDSESVNYFYQVDN